VSFGLEHDFKQDKIYSAFNTETVTGAYTLLNTGIGTDVIWNKHKLFSLYINGTNLADIAYQQTNAIIISLISFLNTCNTHISCY